MRKGTVTYIDLTLVKGRIKDENEQEISFTLDFPDCNIQVGSFVSFEIMLTSDGLVAINLIVLETALIYP